jgi:competence protein ComFC
VKGKTVIIVDDVFTTGSTINEAAKTLVAAGAAEVRAITAARSVINY